MCSLECIKQNLDLVRKLLKNARNIHHAVGISVTGTTMNRHQIVLRREKRRTPSDTGHGRWHDTNIGAHSRNKERMEEARED